jgi:phosphate:Na+ symporter
MNTFLTFSLHRPLARPLLMVGLMSLVFLAATSALGAEAEVEGLDWLTMAKGLFGGLALFLFGMEQMSSALSSALGNEMKELLSRLTRNRFMAVLTGAFVTAVVQSSSVTTVLVVGFVTTGMMTMSQSIGVIMGANVGTTITAQIVAFKVEEAALWMIAIGFLMLYLSKQDRIRHYGSMLMGLGLIFYGMGLMGDGMYPLRNYPPFLDLMGRMDNAFFGILVGAAFTALVQSSSATTAIVITMAAQGVISLEAGIALAFGANIGTCVTALLATLGKSREALRAATAHVVFNVAGVLIWLPFISLLASWVTGVSPSHPELEGSARLAAEVPRQIANAHTLFNIANTLIFIAFTTQIGRIVKWLVPEKAEEEKVLIRPKFLNEAMIDTPALALQSARMEIARMGDIVAEMFSGLRHAFLEQDRNKLDHIQRQDGQVDVLEGEILRYLAKIRKQELSDEENRDVALSMKGADMFKSIGDVIENDLVNLYYRVYDEGFEPSETMRHLLRQLGDKLEQALGSTTQAVRELDQRAAQDVLTMKADIDHLLDQALELQSRSLAGSEKDIETIRIEMALLENLKRIHTYLKRIARTLLPKEVGG